MNDEAIERERDGAAAGLSPMFGEWRQRFALTPVPYSAGGAKRAEFRNALRSALSNQFLFTGEVKVAIGLGLDAQTVLETSDTADLDNYAKCILDGIKGNDGIIIDDSQIQSLTIYWIGNNDRESSHFLIEINSHPDSFSLKPVSFYEMPDRLWYPLSKNFNGPEKIETIGIGQFFAILMVLEKMIREKLALRHALRQSGERRFRSFYHSMRIAPSIHGFHKSRIDSQFSMHERKEWKAQIEEWRRQNPNDAAKFDEWADGFRNRSDGLEDAISSPPAEADDNR